jgi:glutathione S-transferase
MKLHYSPASTTSLPIVLFCADNGIPLDLQAVDLMSGQHKSEAYLKINPWGLVPALDDDGFVLTESSAILKYVADKVESAAYPRDRKKRARVNECMDWVNTQIYRELGYHYVYPQILPHHVRSPEAAQTATVEWGRDQASRALATLDQVLGPNPYLCGDEITIADYFAAEVLHAGSLVGADYARYPNVQRWLDTMKARPSWGEVNQVYDGLAASLADKSFVPLSA